MRRRVAARGVSILARAAILLACGCARDSRQGPVAWLVIEAPDLDPDLLAALGSARVEPACAVVRSIRSGARLTLGIDAAARPHELRVEVPGACPLAIPSSELAPGATDHRTLVPRIEVRLPAHPRDLGYGAPFELGAAARCPGPSGGSVVWRQVSGPAIRDVRTGTDGLRFEARTADVGEVRLDAPARGIVPVSPRTSGAIVIEAAWRPARGEPSPGEGCRVTLSAASRARGLPNVGVGEGVLLAGAGWSVTAAPRGAAAALEPSGAMARLVPDAAGAWVLRDAAGGTLSLQAGRYDETALDCGRSGCHGPIADAVRASPMTTALRRLIGDDARTPDETACAIACHATGEPGTHDGGFSEVASGVDLGSGWSFLPRAARRLGGVTCLACHGPGAIPEPSARWAILRADVCATCHDAPPTYGHVAAWRSSRMARSDADPRTRTDASCARCHTTSGFLASLGGGAVDRTPPPDVETTGIACAACHAAHDPHGNADTARADRLLRDVTLPDSFRGVPVPERSRICVRCHAPAASFASGADGALAPPASAAAIWAGRGGIDPQTGDPLGAPSVHGAVDGGCVGCHRGGPVELERGSGHAFRADVTSCAGCHGDTVPDTAAIGREIRDRAAFLLASLAGVRPPVASDPRHAGTLGLPRDRIGRAVYDVLLVLEDPAAAAHNTPFARALLAAAARVIPGAKGDTP